MQHPVCTWCGLSQASRACKIAMLGNSPFLQARYAEYSNRAKTQGRLGPEVLAGLHQNSSPIDHSSKEGLVEVCDV